MQHPTCDLYDRFEDKARVLPPVFSDFGGITEFRGEAVTVKCFEDNSRVKEMLSSDGYGKVLVVDGGGSRLCALLGDVIARGAVDHRWEGIVIFGCVRDRAALRTLRIGVKALGVTPRKSTRRGEGQTSVPIDIAGVACNPGDFVFADEDGVVILEPGQVEALGA